jgi:hypothetical protein
VVEAKNKNRVFKAANLEQLAEDLDEGGTKLWGIAKVTWLKESNRKLGVCGAAKIYCSTPIQQGSAPSASNRVIL